MRALVTVQEIADIQPIEGADRIVCVLVLGWKLVVKKDSFHVGEKCIYYEIDSFLPMEEQYEFLRASSYRKHPLLGEGYRIKTMRLRGQISQGLALPLSEFGIAEDTPVGTDLTKQLGVRKWEQIELGAATGFGRMKKGLPLGVLHSDETRIQTIYPDIMEEFRDLPYYITTKIDGTSISMFMKDHEFGVCSHNNTILRDDQSSSIPWAYAKQYRIEEQFREQDLEQICITGELAGERIQKNRLKLKEYHWFVFSVTDMREGRRYGLAEMKELCDRLGLEMVPVEETGENLLEKYPDLDSLLARAEGNYPSGQKKEGIVVRPINPVRSLRLQTWLSFKVLNNAFLLKES